MVDSTGSLCSTLAVEVGAGAGEEGIALGGGAGLPPLAKIRSNLVTNIVKTLGLLMGGIIITPS